MKNNLKLFRELSSEICLGDYDRAEKAVRKIISLKDDLLTLKFLKNSWIDHTGTLWVNSQFVVGRDRQQVVDYAFWQLIALAPEAVCRRTGIIKDEITRIRFQRYGPFIEETPDVFAFPDAKFQSHYLSSDFLLQRFPSELWRFSSLQKLDCSGTSFSEIPKSIGKCRSLTSLCIKSFNGDALPDEIGKLIRLEEFVIQEGKLSGLPESFGNLRKLKILVLRANRFKEIPDIIGSLGRLTHLSFYANRIKKIPVSLSGCRNLVKLNMGQNEIKSVPKSVASLSKLEELDLNNNSDLKKIHPSLTRLSQLKIVDTDFCDALTLSRRRWFTGEHIEQFFFEISGKKIVKKETYPETAAHSGLQKSELTTPSVGEGSVQVISEMLKSKDESLLRPAFNLLLAAADPALTEQCLSTISFPTEQDVMEVNYYPEESDKFYYELFSFLNLPECPALSGPGSWRSSVTNLIYSVDNLYPVDLKNTFPHLSSFGLHCADEDCSYFSFDFSELRILALRAFDGFNFTLNKKLKSCVQVRIIKSIFRGELFFNGLPSLTHIELHYTETSVTKIRNCVSLKSIVIFVSRNIYYPSEDKKLQTPPKIIISGCAALEEIDIQMANIADLQIVECPNLKRLIVRGQGKNELIINCKGSSGLQFAEISRCKLSEVPSFLMQSTKMEFLDLSYNSIIQLPRTFEKFKKIRELRISGNKLAEIPDCLSGLSSLEFLDLGWQINSDPAKSEIKSLPSGLGGLKNLRRLRVSMPETELRRSARIFHKNKPHLYNPPASSNSWSNADKKLDSEDSPFRAKLLAMKSKKINEDI